MKSNWFAHEDYLSYSATAFIGFVELPLHGSKYFSVYFSNGIGANIYKETNFENFKTLHAAVERVEKFFEQDYSKQKEWFEAHALERDRDIELKRRKVSISY